ncbi:MAG: hypothetical protein JRJ85_15615, partial [Deltaproteobacteria bacterium]|nr:hypothetical protein [Deltaproteobacteria bacterium]
GPEHRRLPAALSGDELGPGPSLQLLWINEPEHPTGGRLIPGSETDASAGNFRTASICPGCSFRAERR